jgi:hypothetical protein
MSQICGENRAGVRLMSLRKEKLKKAALPNLAALPNAIFCCQTEFFYWLQ